MRRRHSAGKHRLGARAIPLLGQQQGHPGAFGVAGPEEGQPVDMVPVQVRQQDDTRVRLAFHQQGDLAQAGPGVENERRHHIAVMDEGHTGCVAPVTDELRSRCRRRTACAAEVNPHWSDPGDVFAPVPAGEFLQG